MTASRGRKVVWLVLAASGCVLTAPSRAPPAEPDPILPRELEGTASRATSPADSRVSLGFVLESALRARRLRPGRPAMFLELSSGATVIDGDRLQVAIRTSRDAYMYIAFCSQHASDSRYGDLKVFPEQGSIRVRAFETAIAPDRAAEIVLDRKPGQEALYLILSPIELSESDAALAEAITSARHGNQSTDCGGPFRTGVSAPRKNADKEKDKDTDVNRVWSRHPRGKRQGPKQPDVGAENDPVVEIQRGGDIVWNNGEPTGVEPDQAGIVILRYRLTHVAAP